jgi:hypothetical protein
MEIFLLDSLFDKPVLPHNKNSLHSSPWSCDCVSSRSAVMALFHAECANTAKVFAPPQHFDLIASSKKPIYRLIDVIWLLSLLKLKLVCADGRQVKLCRGIAPISSAACAACDSQHRNVVCWLASPYIIYREKRLYQNVGTRKITYIEKRNAAARPCSHKAAAAVEVKFIKSRKVMSF